MKKLIILMLCSIMLFVTACGSAKEEAPKKDQDTSEYKAKYEHLLTRQPASIKSIEFFDEAGNLIENSGSWVEVEGFCRIKLTLDSRATRVDFFASPTGTEAYKLQRLLDMVYPESEEVNFEIEFPKDFMGRIWFVVYIDTLGRIAEDINLLSK